MHRIASGSRITLRSPDPSEDTNKKMSGLRVSSFTDEVTYIPINKRHGSGMKVLAIAEVMHKEVDDKDEL